MSRALLSLVSTAARRKGSSGVGWGRFQFLDLKRDKNKWDLQGMMKTTTNWYLLLFLLPSWWRNRRQNQHPSGRKNFTYLYFVYSVTRDLSLGFKTKPQSLPAPIHGKCLSTEWSLGSTLSKKTTGLDQQKVWKTPGLIWKLLFTLCLDIHGCRLSMSMLTDPDTKSKIKSLWSSATSLLPRPLSLWESIHVLLTGELPTEDTS